MRLSHFQDGELLLRPVEPSDASLLQSWESDPAIATSNTLVEPMARYQAQQWVDLGHSHLASNGFVLFIASVRRGDELVPIGYIELYNYDFYHRRVAVGVMLLPAYRGKGYARRMLDLMVAHAKDLRLNILYAEVVANNLLGKSFFDATPFIPVATLPHWYWDQGDYQDLIIYQLCLV
ncbi:GNAT family N-acetyltransferase [Porphyromonas circumdentaria]|uniref:Diamine N-acetyltransferase n=1 Tax=Porphyromonas circumdentaria TaxID=29524 RepID=A0A1T4MH62_9PORP|nr:GNAT family protein [Porphyromonas circumdentaria]MBB6275757.1 diamine N-acetyltransferase [Porphyromonas circumdentaria]MDO4721737.1 GNAT family protein [Porphyromonas circumdentaria]SJZ66186.1 diamine N-acetyltransferase [Porphyromonas circumdentaria]